MNSTDITIKPAFVGDATPAFCVYYMPVTTPRGHIIYLPPFAEEMNRCRAIVAEQARWFAISGFTCTTLDFFGTGESFGKLTEAKMDIWHRNIEDLITSLLAHCDAPIYFWGCRLGGLIAVDYLQSHMNACYKLLLWQPVVSGKIFITQMLRQRTASLMERGQPTESTNDIRARLAEGECIEVAGYTLGGELISELDQLDMCLVEKFTDKSIFWLEHSMDGSGTPSPKSARAIAHLEQLGSNIVYRSFTGQPLWQLHERDTCEGLLEATRELAL